MDQEALARRLPRARLLFALAASPLRHRPLHLFLLLLAVSFGTGMQIPNMANLAGYNHELVRAGVSDSRGEVVLTPAHGRFITDWPELRERLRRLTFVKQTIPELALPGAIVLGSKLEGVAVVGRTPDRGIGHLHIARGSALGEGDRGGIVVAAEVAKRLKLEPGDQVRVHALVDFSGPLAVDDQPVAKLELTVRGIVGGPTGDAPLAWVDRQLLLEALGEEDVAMSVRLHTRQPFEAEAHARLLAGQLAGVVATPWQRDSNFIPQAIASNRMLALISSLMVLLAVAIPVWALLFISVQHRRVEIGLLSALGFSEGDIFVSFVVQGALIGLAGVLLGTGIGYGLVRYFMVHPIFAMEGFVVRPVVTLATLLQPAAVVLAATILASIYPAVAAARIAPGLTMRGE